MEVSRSIDFIHIKQIIFTTKLTWWLEIYIHIHMKHIYIISNMFALCF